MKQAKEQYALYTDKGTLHYENGHVVFESVNYEITDIYDHLDEAINAAKLYNQTSKLENGNEIEFTGVVEAWATDDEILEVGQVVHDQARWELEYEFLEEVQA